MTTRHSKSHNFDRAVMTISLLSAVICTIGFFIAVKQSNVISSIVLGISSISLYINYHNLRKLIKISNEIEELESTLDKF